ncbi:DNA/RNA nuclease SfsA [candidate division KSB1 bacterium]|nr:DNA/RNA nuclease SfsA [candidate division KSB1 bacterium]NIR68597.1 DNA/RNA nuclease SfsA [candidate division KSB1 bacterium]NIS25434.1 DNA/RNA nuclease SfsA [candidate division KSB1 bacterium]NIT72326.1 DNA/RNA nuclease SfsA [candidate division KSB1 bacterium]NIU26110.1 DNA/RNA nuclease SfsA [candidate division KSB1 bacterium]
MKLPEPLIPGKLIERYKRFLADVQLEDRTVTAHCPNSGSMMGLLQKGNDVLLSESGNPKRKLPYTWELVRVGPTWVGVNTINPNRMIHEALLNGEIPELSQYSDIKREVIWKHTCRFDFMLKNGQKTCFVEVKNVTLEENGLALFPDAKTERGVKHLRHLKEAVSDGHRAVMCFLVNREDCTFFMPAETIDPVYADSLRDAYENGVEIVVYRANITPPEVVIDGALDFEL